MLLWCYKLVFFSVENLTDGFIFIFFIHKGVQLFICYFASHHKTAQWTLYEGFWVCGTEFCSVFLFFYLKPLASHLSLLVLLLLWGAHTFLTTKFCPLLVLLFSVYKIYSNLPQPNHSFQILFQFMNLQKRWQIFTTK